LPLPEGPTNAILVFGSILNEKFYNTFDYLSGYLKVTFLNSIVPLISD
jgi:hypothetical protein